MTERIVILFSWLILWRVWAKRNKTVPSEVMLRDTMVREFYVSATKGQRINISGCHIERLV